MLQKLTIELDISEPSEVSEGVFVTHITHPHLDGTLSFTHSVGTRSSVLGALQKPEDDPIRKLIELTVQAAAGLGFKM